MIRGVVGMAGKAVAYRVAFVCFRRIRPTNVCSSSASSLEFFTGARLTLANLTTKSITVRSE